MNLVPPLPGQPARGTELLARRCARHGEREAVARCPACTGYFCRECIVEHEGRVLCSTCLATELRASRRTSSSWQVWRKRASLVAAFLFAWLAFYGMGALLLKIPSKVHDGTIWQSSDAESETP